MKNNPSFLMDLIFIITTHQDNIKIAVFIFSNVVRKFFKLIYFVLLCIMQKTDEVNNYCSFVFMKTFDDVRQLKNQNQHGNDIQIF